MAAAFVAPAWMDYIPIVMMLVIVTIVAASAVEAIMEDDKIWEQEV